MVWIWCGLFQLKGSTFESSDNKVPLEIKKPSQQQSNAGNVNKSSVPNTILRKPPQRWTSEGEDMSLLGKPEPPLAKDEDTNQESFTRADNENDLKMSAEDSSGEAGANIHLNIESSKELEQHYEFQQELSDSSQLSNLSSVDKVELSVQATQQGKPQRECFYEYRRLKNNDELGNPFDVSNFQEGEDANWTTAEDLIRNGDRVDVEILSCSSKGFIASFGSLVGFLPYHNLVSKWKFLAFESWLRKKGLDPSMYKQSLDTITSYDAENKNVSPNSPLYQENDTNVEEKLSPDMKMEDLLRIYD
ncbi:uncharacterized protein LOC110262440 [Arachis ipaensis]|uniref:uncharacterized protein LOC110262440 n=1 Tax=Arachis ipaensis TaxID=130454 RepID=UPI000A2B12BF|nr:uncharacterized protein LOC110262440 [Arachis ipaensis]